MHFSEASGRGQTDWLRPEELLVPPYVPSPAEQEWARLTNTLQVVGMGQGSWERWPQEAGVSPVPQPVRIGCAEFGGRRQAEAPLMLPAVGDGHLIVGNPQLAVPVEPYLRRVPITQERRMRADAETTAAKANIERSRRFAGERKTAIHVARAYIARAAGALPSGQLEVTVHEPLRHAHDFAAFTAMNTREESTRYTVEDNLPVLLAQLEEEIETRSNKLGVYGSLRKLAESGLPESYDIPWRIVALIGSGEQLTSADQRRLDKLLRYGPIAGVSFILSGFAPSKDVAKSVPFARLHIHSSDKISASTLPKNLAIHLDRPPTPDEMRRAVMGQPPVHIVGPRPDSGVYHQTVARRYDLYQAARAAEAVHIQEFPLLQAKYLRLASDPARLSEQLAGDGKKPSAADWAQMMVALTPGGLRAMRVDERLRPHLEQFAGTQPPAWLYRYVADAATIPSRSYRNAASSALQFELARAFYPERAAVPTFTDKRNWRLRDALIELRWLELRGFDVHTPEAVRNELLDRAQPRLQKIKREQLPETAHGIFDLYAKYAEPTPARAAGWLAMRRRR